VLTDTATGLRRHGTHPAGGQLARHLVQASARAPRRPAPAATSSGKTTNAIAVAVLADDPLTLEGAVVRLSGYRQIAVLDADQQQHAQVLLVLAAAVNDEVLTRMQHAYGQAPNRDLSVVLVAAEVAEQHVLRAIGCGLVSLLRRQEAGYDQIVAAILGAHHGRAQLPQVTQRYLLDQLRRIQHQVLAPMDLTVSGLTLREIEVLKLLAEGSDTAEIAARLNYSERTVKNVVGAVMTRFDLRNRTQAVAFALRTGAL
jgi:DNA-binding NarL/FixJ family response regulator